MQFVACEALFYELFNQTLVRNDVFVQFCFVEDGDAGIVGHDKDGRHILSIFPSDPCDGLSRKEMNADYAIIAAGLDYMSQPFGEQHAEKVNGGFPFELQGTVPLRESVYKTEQSDLY